MTNEERLPPPAELALPIGEAIFTHRAIRKFKRDPISDADLKLMLDAASKAPNGGNLQLARFLVIRSPERIRAFGALYREAWWAKRREGPGWKRLEDIPPTEKTFLAAAQLADEIAEAPVIILAFSVVRADLGHSVFPAVQNLLLAARALGIGSTLTTLHDDVMPRVYAMFDIPESAQFHACIPLGYPRGRFGLTPRRPTSETTFWDRWDQPPPWE
ncbi:MAG: nitroreductase family protein [Deltaproteobacteria bacterium]|jgi:nitroreductase|nr:nitroreductase family protein [Deltaproteobacteria bacterium]MBW2496194.1 nitroreductase family protein [Deltaproteobacteria bacterium]